MTDTTAGMAGLSSTDFAFEDTDVDAEVGVL